jgi:hypothetical protein
MIKKIIPKKKKNDKLYNRRVMSYGGLLFSVLWFQQVLIIVAAGYFFDAHIGAPVVVALLGVPATLAGLGYWRYLEACKHEDHNRSIGNVKKEAAGLPDSKGPKNPEIPPADSGGQKET